MKNLKPQLLMLLMAITLTGCSDPVERMLTEYPTRLERVLEVELDIDSPADIPVPLVARPSRRELTLPLQQADINLLEFLKLNQCQLGRVVGEKNSVLGKLAQSSQQMHLERDFLIWAPACIAALEDQSLAEQLEQAWQMKRDQRMAVWWNGWMAGEEFQSLTSLSVYPLAATAEAHMQHTLLGLEFAVRQGQRWQALAFEYRSADVEHHLRQWSLGESLGRWQISQMRLTRVLEYSTRLVQQRQQQKPLCPAGRKTRKAEIVQNVLELFYVAELQPYMSQSDRFGADMLARLKQLEELSDAVPESWRSWLAQLQQSRMRFQQASRTHVQTMSGLFDSCGMSVGKPDQ